MRIWKTIFVSLLITFNCVALVYASPLEEAISDFESRRYSDAIVKFVNLSEEKKPVAKRYLGIIALYGLGVDKNVSKAEKMFLESSECGDAKSKYYLGLIYSKKNSHYYDLDKALRYYKESADLGDEIAMYSLAIISFDSGKISFDEYLKLLKESAHKNYGLAQYQLSTIYFNGDGVDRNYSEALSWAMKAYKNKVDGIEYIISRIYYEGFNDLDSAEKYALEGADKNDLQSIKLLVFLYGEGDKNNTVRQFNMMHKGAVLGDKDLQHFLASSYISGSHGYKKPKKAMEWALKSVESGNVKANFIIASIYNRGIFYGKDLKKAEWYYKQCIEEDECRFYYALMQYFNGEVFNKKEGLHTICNMYRKGYPDAIIFVEEAGIDCPR